MFHAYRKWGAGVMLAACGVIPFIGGCAAAGPGTSPGGTGGPLVVRDSANGHTVTVTVGEDLEVILGSTYWTVPGSSHPGVLRQDGPDEPYAAPGRVRGEHTRTGVRPGAHGIQRAHRGHHGDHGQPRHLRRGAAVHAGPGALRPYRHRPRMD